MNNHKGKKLLRMVPVILFVLAVPLFFSCDPGSDAGQPTGPGSEFNPGFPEGSILELTLNPTRVVVGNFAKTVALTVSLNAPGAVGAPLEGIPIAFDDEAAPGDILFFPNPSYTDVNGMASATATVQPGIPPGSYTLTAWSSFGSGGGPDARDFKILLVTEP